MANNNRSNKSKTNLSIKSIVSNKSSSPSTITCDNYAKRHSNTKIVKLRNCSSAALFSICNIEAVFKEVVLSYFRCGITTKTSQKAEETETKVQDLFSRELGVNKDDFDYELNKAHRLPINSAESTRHDSPPNIICKFRVHRFREQLYSQKKKDLQVN